MTKYIVVLCIMFLQASCTSKIEENNKKFLKQYGEEVKRINEGRKNAVQPRSNNSHFNQIKFESPVNIVEEEPTGSEIHDAVYSAQNYPTQYNRGRVSFDNIKVPNHDFFGIKSNLEDKEYDMVDNAVLQESIDHVDSYFDPRTREINVILLKEKEEIRKNKMEKLFLVSQKDKDNKD